MIFRRGIEGDNMVNKKGALLFPDTTKHLSKMAKRRKRDRLARKQRRKTQQQMRRRS